MIDFISVIKYDCKDSLFLGHCDLVHPTDCYGNARYYLQGCEKMKVTHNVRHDWLKIEGSLPYYLNGHNFAFPNDQCIQAIEHINAMLGDIDLWNAYVNTFESGVIMPVALKPSEYIAHHYASKGSKLKKRYDEKDRGRNVIWVRTGEEIKMYDEDARIRQMQSKDRRQEVIMSGWNPDQYHLKLEIRYTKPEWINNNKPVRMQDLTDDKFNDMLKTNLLDQYHLLSPVRSVVFPDDKKDCNSLDIALITIMRAYGESKESMKDKIYQTINDTEYDKKDKDARKRTINEAIKGLIEDETSQWDLTDNIIEEISK